MTENRCLRDLLRVAAAAALALSLSQCSAPILVPNPPQRVETPEEKPADTPPPAPDPAPEKTARSEASPDEKELDFADAFIGSAPAAHPAAKSPAATAAYRVAGNMVRIALERRLGDAVLYAVETVTLRPAPATRWETRGRISVRAAGSRKVRLSPARGRSLTVMLPCTLLARSPGNLFQYDGKSYRGSVILDRSNKAGRFSVINYLPVEDYLQGVVPLEIGRRPDSEIEAVKAQAIAARTYTYKRILQRLSHPFDLLPTVADQVYGGILVETPQSNRAVAETRNLVMTWGDSLITAYYHSTCGGMTANIEDVWDKPARPYLRSVADTPERGGKAYCSISRYYEWEERWKTIDLSRTLSRFLPSAYPKAQPIRGNLRSLRVRKRYPCGRIAACRITTSSGTHEHGGDRIRFLFRRSAGEHPILRSARFDVALVSRGEVRLHGYGYGHGVGLCQMGAVGRARAGQSCEQILKAYYTGIELRRVVGR